MKKTLLLILFTLFISGCAKEKQSEVKTSIESTTTSSKVKDDSIVSTTIVTSKKKKCPKGYYWDKYNCILISSKKDPDLKKDAANPKCSEGYVLSYGETDFNANGPWCYKVADQLSE